MMTTNDLTKTTGTDNPIRPVDPMKLNPEMLKVFAKDYQGKVAQLPNLLMMEGCNSQYLDYTNYQ